MYYSLRRLYPSKLAARMRKLKILAERKNGRKLKKGVIYGQRIKLRIGACRDFQDDEKITAPVKVL